jgi:REP-associated tyrosine transposase
MISGACYEHASIIGMNHQRMSDCEESLLTLCKEFATALYAWCVLPNHYHLLLRTDRLTELRAELGKFHGRTSFVWNGEDSSRGRKVWHNCLDRGIKSHGHFWAAMNYIHNNPVHHGYVARWQDWPWSSAAQFLKRVGHDTAAKIWREFPPLDYGKTWDFD